MKVEIITTNADPNRGGSPGRVHGLVSMFAQFADVRVVLTDGHDGGRVSGVRYEAVPLPDTFRTRLRRMRTYYRADFPPRNATDVPDFVVVESLDLLGLHQYGPRVPLILDEHNVYWNLLRYSLADAPFFRGWLGRRTAVRRIMIPRLLNRAKRFEIEAIRGACRTLVTSDADRGAILAECPDVARKVHVLPNCVDVHRMPAFPAASGSRNVLFVGDFNYVPNRQAAEFVGQTLAPALPEARFFLVGSNPPRETLRAPNVVATGHVKDLQEVLRESAVCIAPLAHGSGTRVKILTYLAAGRPVVATSKAAEGLPVQDGRDLLIRDDPAEFCFAVRDLLENPEEQRRLAANGRGLVESMFDWRVHVDWLRRFSSEVCAGLGS